MKPADDATPTDAEGPVGDPTVVHSEPAAADAQTEQRRHPAHLQIESDEREEAGYGYGV